MRKDVKKDVYSEWVIRNSLYLLTSLTQWKLCEDISPTISFENDSPECFYEFERLLNDYTFARKISIKQGRREILLFIKCFAVSMKGFRNGIDAIQF